MVVVDFIIPPTESILFLLFVYLILISHFENTTTHFLYSFCFVLLLSYLFIVYQTVVLNFNTYSEL